MLARSASPHPPARRATRRGSAAPPRRRRPDERPGELLDAALRVFATHGYRRTTLEQVAAAAGVTKGAVYHYFPDKQALLLRALAQHQDRALGRLEDLARGGDGSAAERLRRFLRSAFGDDDRARRDVLALLQDIAHEAPAVHHRWLANGPARGWRLLAGLIAAGQASGEFRADLDADATARLAISGLLMQVVLQQHAHAVPALQADPARLVEAAADLLIAGLARPRRTRRRP